jgi:erythronate-4-phosphate dehydrogenase
MKIVADNKIPFLQGALEPYAEVVYVPANLINVEILKEADALLIRTRTKCNSDLLERTRVKFIGTATIGFDHIDTNYCNKKNITWTNAPGCNSSSVQQYIAAALLKISSEFGFSLKDKTLGIIGVGNVGSKVEMFARRMGMNVLLNDPPRERSEGKKNFKSLNSVLSSSDIVTIHVPLNLKGEDPTFHLFSEEIFGKFKQGAWFFNSSRGEVTDTNALKKMLCDRKLAGAVLDVWENEPDIDTELMWEAYIATPHIAGYSIDGKANGTAMIVNSLCRYFNFPLEKWYPVNIPLPASPYFSIDCKNKHAEEIVREAVIHTYKIDEDSTRLRLSPADFEKLRGEYPIRREFPAYTAELAGGTEKVRQILNELGFRISM